MIFVSAIFASLSRQMTRATLTAKMAAIAHANFWWDPGSFFLTGSVTDGKVSSYCWIFNIGF
jgi:hypothetical protein